MTLPEWAASSTSKFLMKPRAILRFLTNDSSSYYEADPNGYDGNHGGACDYTYDGVYEEDIQLE